MTTLDDFKNALISKSDSATGLQVYNSFVTETGAEDAASFVSRVGAEDAASFVSRVGAEDAADFVYNVGGSQAGTFVSVTGDGDPDLEYPAGFVTMLERPDDIASKLLFVYQHQVMDQNALRGLVDSLFEEGQEKTWYLDDAISERDTAISERDTAISERDTARDERDTAIAEANDLLHVAEKNNVGFDIANKDLTGKNLSGLKIKSLEGCGYDPSNPPNFSRCDLTGCDMTKLIQLKKWEHLMGETLQNAEQTINDDPDNFNVVTLAEGSLVTTDFDITRVRIWYNESNIVSRVPIVG